MNKVCGPSFPDAYLTTLSCCKGVTQGKTHLEQTQTGECKTIDDQPSTIDRYLNTNTKVIINMIAMSILPYVILIPFGGPVPLIAKLAVTVLLSATAMLTDPTEEDIAQVKTSKSMQSFAKVVLFVNMLSIILITTNLDTYGPKMYMGHKYTPDKTYIGRFFSLQGIAANATAAMTVMSALRFANPKLGRIEKICYVVSQIIIPHLMLLSHIHVAIKIAAITVSAASLAYEALMLYTSKEPFYKEKDDVLCYSHLVIGLHMVSSLPLAMMNVTDNIYGNANPAMIFPILGMFPISMSGLRISP